jgi:hypothetical protein
VGIQHPGLRGHVFLADLVGDSYYPGEAVGVVQGILGRLCERIEAERPGDLAALYGLTHAATEEVNEAQQVFWDAGSEIETVARDAIGTEIELIATTYGFADADVEELIAPRDW